MFVIKTAIETISTYFGERSNSFYQMAKEWKVYAEENGYEHAKFPSKLGSRWNIGFAICSVLYYHRQNLLKFLKKTNYCVESHFAALMKVLENPALMNMVKIGAAIDQVVNGPWWNELDSDKHISDINISNAEFVKYFEKVAEDPKLFDTEIPLLTPRTDKQILYRNAALSNVSPSCLAMIPNFYKNIANYLKKEFLPLSYNPKINDAEYKDELASAAASNKVCEQTFSTASSLRQQSSSTSNIRLGYTTCAIKNGTGGWYNSFSPKQQEDLLAKAREARRRSRRDIRERKDAGENNNTLDNLIGKNFNQKWENEEGEYICIGYVKRKDEDGFVLCYPPDEDEAEEEIEINISFEELNNNILTKKIIFDE
jgi:hypothetical protein